MIWGIIATVLLAMAGYGLIVQDTKIAKLEKMLSGTKLADGEILPVIQDNENISYYKDLYREDGVNLALHTIGAKGWSFQQCKEYGMVITCIREHQFEVGVDMLKYMIEAYARDAERYRIDTEKNAAAFEAAKDTETTVSGEAQIFVSLEDDKVTEWEENNKPIDE